MICFWLEVVRLNLLHNSIWLFGKAVAWIPDGTVRQSVHPPFTIHSTCHNAITTASCARDLLSKNAYGFTKLCSAPPQDSSVRGSGRGASGVWLRVCVRVFVCMRTAFCVCVRVRVCACEILYVRTWKLPCGYVRECVYMRGALLVCVPVYVWIHARCGVGMCACVQLKGVWEFSSRNASAWLWGYVSQGEVWESSTGKLVQGCRRDSEVELMTVTRAMKRRTCHISSICIFVSTSPHFTLFRCKVIPPHCLEKASVCMIVCVGYDCVGLSGAGRIHRSTGRYKQR